MENDWKMAAAYCLPRQLNQWNSERPITQSGIANAGSRVAYDTTGTRSLSKYVAVLNRLCTPETQRWAGVKASNPDLMKLWSVRNYFDQLGTLLHNTRYGARARFIQAIGESYTGIGVYGMGPIYLGERKRGILDRKGGFVYKAPAMKDVFILTDDEGNVDTVFRRFFLTARNARNKFGDDKLGPKVQAELTKAVPSDTQFFEFVHMVTPRTNHDPESLSMERHPFSASFICIEDASYVGEEGGFRSMPYLTPRTFTEADNPYGYSPAMQAMPALGGVSAMKKTVLKQGQKAVDPTILANDDGVLSGRVDLRPGKVNYGGVNAEGKKLIQTLETGDFRVAESLLSDERRDIEDSFFVTLFTILTETPEMTATEVMERLAEKASLLAPTMGRLQAELLGPMIDREIDIAAEIGLLPQMPPELVEAEGAYDIVYLSPLAKSMHAESMGGFMRTVDFALSVASAKGDPSVLDAFDFDVAIPEMADYQGVPARWMKDMDAIKLVRDQREEQQESDQIMQQAPALASVATAAMKEGAGTANGKA